MILLLTVTCLGICVWNYIRVLRKISIHSKCQTMSSLHSYFTTITKNLHKKYLDEVILVAEELPARKGMFYERV
jgi:hypothetical protein